MASELSDLWSSRRRSRNRLGRWRSFCGGSPGPRIGCLRRPLRQAARGAATRRWHGLRARGCACRPVNDLAAVDCVAAGSRTGRRLGGRRVHRSSGTLRVSCGLSDRDRHPECHPTCDCHSPTAGRWAKKRCFRRDGNWIDGHDRLLGMVAGVKATRQASCRGLVLNDAPVHPP